MLAPLEWLRYIREKLLSTLSDTTLQSTLARVPSAGFSTNLNETFYLHYGRQHVDKALISPFLLSN